jgi:hypothetical protein
LASCILSYRLHNKNQFCTNMAHDVWACHSQLRSEKIGIWILYFIAKLALWKYKVSNEKCMSSSDVWKEKVQVLCYKYKGCVCHTVALPFLH